MKCVPPAPPLAGRVISRTGHYRLFPIAGTATMTVGLLLLSRLDVGTSSLAADLYLLVLGLGLGMVMQVLVLAVQNAVSSAFFELSRLKQQKREETKSPIAAPQAG